MEKHVTYLELEHKAYSAIKELNYDFKLAGWHDEWRTQAYENGEPKPMGMPNCSKKKLKDGMKKGYKNVSLMQVIMYCYTTLV